MFSAIFEFLSDIEVSRAGDASFIQAVLGFNVAFVAWERFREKIQVFGAKADDVVSVATANTLDGSAKKRIGKFFVSLSKRSKKIHSAILMSAYTLAWGSIISSLYMLWASRYCRFDFLLLLPIVGYFTMLLFVWGVLSGLARLVSWLCEEDVERDIDELERMISAATSKPPERQ